MADAANDPPLHVFSIDDGEYLQSLGRSGEGPFEFVNLRTFAPADESNELWAFDLNLQRLTRVGADDSGFTLDSMIDVRVGEALTGPVWLSKQQLASLGISDRGRLLVVDPLQQRVVRIVGAVPFLGDSVPAFIAQQAYRAELYRRPNSERLVALTRHADQLEFFELSNDSTWIVVGPDGFGPRFTLGAAGPARFATDGTLRFGYIGAAVTEEWIVALYSGRQRQDGQANFGWSVRVFDWNGKLLSEVVLARPAIGIALDQTRNAAYTVVHEPEPAVLRLPLGEVVPTDSAGDGRLSPRN